MKTKTLKKYCRCGHDLNHPKIISKANYTKSGFTLLAIAYSARPAEIIFQCSDCGEIIAVSDDKQTCEDMKDYSDFI